MTKSKQLKFDEDHELEAIHLQEILSKQAIPMHTEESQTFQTSQFFITKVKLNMEIGRKGLMSLQFIFSHHLVQKIITLIQIYRTMS